MAALALEAATQHPSLRVVGIDIWEPALALARANVASSPHAERIELRKQDVTSIDDVAAYTLAWLPAPFLAKEVAALKALGVRMVLSTRVGRDLPWERLADMSDALLVCVGALEDARLGIPGEGLPGVLPGCAFLDRVARGERPEIGRRVVVVGGGNSAVDAARTARRLGAEVTIVYRRAKSDMPANAEELAGADEEEVRILALSRPEEILAGAEGRVRALKGKRMKAGPIDASGRPEPVPAGQLHEIACDTVVVAVGERVDASGIGALVVELERDGRI